MAGMVRLDLQFHSLPPTCDAARPYAGRSHKFVSKPKNRGGAPLNRTYQLRGKRPNFRYVPLHAPVAQLDRAAAF